MARSTLTTQNRRPVKGPIGDDPLTEVAFMVDPDAEEAVTAMINDATGAAAAVLARPDQVAVRVSFYLDITVSSAHRDPRLQKLRQGLARIQKAGLLINPPEISITPIHREDWAESWKLHFKPISIGKRLLLLPDWIDRKPHDGQSIILLNPGLSFGTGQHPTTRFCLEQIVALSAHGPGSFLDIGTGSGILAIAAAKLGYSPILAVDADPECIGVARQNARQNQVLLDIHLRVKDVGSLSPKPRTAFRTVCANLTADLLIRHRDRIAGSVAPDGRLMLAGILTTQFDEVKQAYARLGLRLTRYRTVGEWRSGAFQPVQ